MNVFEVIGRVVVTVSATLGALAILVAAGYGVVLLKKQRQRGVESYDLETLGR